MLKIEKHARGINITEVKENEFKGQYIVEPLYRGYGHTVGNALKSFTFVYPRSCY